MQCVEYKTKALMKYEAKKAEVNEADADDAVEVTNNKSKVEETVGKWHQLQLS